MKRKGAKVADDFKFEVGERYENMKGVYEVISIHRDDMVIRWNNGDEVSTPVDLQKRIIERMAYERKLQQQENSKAKSKKSKRK